MEWRTGRKIPEETLYLPRDPNYGRTAQGKVATSSRPNALLILITYINALVALPRGCDAGIMICHNIATNTSLTRMHIS